MVTIGVSKTVNLYPKWTLKIKLWLLIYLEQNSLTKRKNKADANVDFINTYSLQTSDPENLQDLICRLPK